MKCEDLDWQVDWILLYVWLYSFQILDNTLLKHIKFKKKNHTMADKRKAEDSNDNSQALVKRQRTDEGTSSSSSSTAIIGYQSGNQTIPVNVQRTSNLKAPIMLLQGHKADVFSVRFSPSGKNLASSSFDKSICKWFCMWECVRELMWGEINWGLWRLKKDGIYRKTNINNKCEKNEKRIELW